MVMSGCDSCDGCLATGTGYIVCRYFLPSLLLFFFLKILALSENLTKCPIHGLSSIGTVRRLWRRFGVSGRKGIVRLGAQAERLRSNNLGDAERRDVSWTGGNLLA